MSVQKLDHIGIVVSDLKQAIKQYQDVLGVQLDHIEDYGNGLLKIAFMPLDNILIELIEPLKAGSSAWDYLHEYGEGIEHIAFRVDDVGLELDTMIKKQIPVVDYEPKPGAGGMWIGFLDRSALSGVLGELVSENKDK